MGDRIAVMQGGKIVQVGSPLDIYDYPQSVFVSTFIGSPAINLVDATVKRSPTGSCFARAANDVELQLPNEELEDGRPIVVGVRPEHFQFAADGIPGVVEIVEQTGLDTLAIVNTGHHRLRVLTRGRSEVSVGEKACVQTNRNFTHVFDRASAQRLTVAT